MMKRIVTLFFMLVGLFPLCQVHEILAQVPARISFQSLTLGEEDKPFVDGNYRITFRLYESEQDGMAVWSESQNVPVAEGFISTLIGSERPLNLPFDRPYYLSVEIEGQPESQRMPLAAVPYALVARDVANNTVVRSISGIQDHVDVVAGQGITVNKQGNQLIISAAPGLNQFEPVVGSVDELTWHPAKNATPKSDAEDEARLNQLFSILGPGGSNTGLDAAYDAGRTVTLDDGRIVLIGTPPTLAMELRNGDFVMRDNTGDTPSFRWFVDGVATEQAWRIELDPTSGELRYSNATPTDKVPFRLTKTATDNLMTLNGSALELKNAAGNVKIKLDTNVSGDGRVTTQELEITGGSDLSENFDISSDFSEIAPLPGMVVSIDPEQSGKLKISSAPYDRMVAGVVSGAGGIKTGLLMGQEGTEADGAYPVALTGRVYVYVDAAYGSVSPGDLLTTSSTPGHAMKMTDHALGQGAILGKAMTGLPTGRGLVLMLVTLQ